MYSLLPTVLIVSILFASPLDAFVFLPGRQLENPRLARATAAAAKSFESSDELFASDGWTTIEKSLDTLPVFTCANKEGNPLAYTIELKDKTLQVPLFFCDVDEAKEELEKAKTASTVEGLDVLPFPLGKAFQMWAQDEAVIVPSKMSVVQAGAPPGTNPIGQEVPLFACMDIMQSNEDGSGAMLPMFLSLADAQKAVSDAVAAEGANPDDFEVVSMSLGRAVELLATVPETPAFQFVGPKRSFEYIAEYLSE